LLKYHVSQPCIGARERRLINETLDANNITQGVMVARLEKDLAAFLKAQHVVVVSNGTTALHLALVALGIGPGDEVLVPDLTFVASANAVHYTGARPVLVDVNQRNWCIDLDDAERKTTERTKAILPVHVYGVPVDMGELVNFVVKHPMLIVEDAAEGLGGTFAGTALGTFGDAGTFSFYGNKVMTTGEGGAIATDDGILAERLRFLRGQAHDPRRRYYHPEIGFNYRLTDIQAACGVGQVSHLEGMLARRRDLFQVYRERLSDVLVLPEIPEKGVQAPWLFTGILPDGVVREDVMTALHKAGVETRPTFVPLHEMPMYQQGNFPVAALLGRRGITLPTYPDLSLRDCDEICEIFLRTVRR
jgi:perosamine synthetase